MSELLRRDGVWIIVAVFTVAAVLRLVGLDWSLPNTGPFPHVESFHPDEWTIAHAVGRLNIFDGQMNPHFFNYGSLYIYFVYLLALPQQLIDPAGWNDLSGGWITSVHLLGRLCTVVLGVSTVVLVWALGRRMFRSMVGLVAAVILTLMPIHIMHSHFMSVDVPLAFWSTLSLFLMIKALDKGSLKWFVYASFVVGLATATKYGVGPALFAALFVLAFTMRRRSRAKIFLRMQSWVLPVLAVVVGFFVGCPYAFFDPGTWWQHVSYELFQHARTGHGLVFIDTGNGFWHHLVTNLPAALGWPLALLTFVAIGVTLMRVVARKRMSSGNRDDRLSGNVGYDAMPQILLLVFATVYFVPLGCAQLRFARYLMPLMPLLALLTAKIIVDFCSLWRRNATPVFVSIIGLVLIALVGLYTTGYALSIVSLFVREDPRVQAAKWLQPYTNRGRIIALAHVPWFYTPPLCPTNANNKWGWFDQWRIQSLSRIEVIGMRHDAFTQMPLDFYVISEFEYFDELRLKRPHALSTFEWLEGNTELRSFKNDTSICGFRFGPSVLPHDLLYVNPEIRVYQFLKERRSDKESGAPYKSE